MICPRFVYVFLFFLKILIKYNFLMLFYGACTRFQVPIINNNKTTMGVKYIILNHTWLVLSKICYHYFFFFVHSSFVKY